MTLTTPYQASFYVGDGETKAFPFVFEEVSDNFVKVIVSHIDGTTSIPTYTVDLDLKQVVFGDETPAPTADDIVCIYRETPTIQDTPFKTLEGYNAKALENILSKIVAMIQEIKSNYFSTQVLQGDPWQLDLLKSADDGATVNIDYVAKKLVKGLYFQITNGNLQVSADGNSYITMPKSADIVEFRQVQTVLEDLTVQYRLQYRIGNEWFNAESNAEATADEAKQIAEEARDIASDAKDIAQDASDKVDGFDDRITQAEQDASDAKDIAQDASDAVSAHIADTNNPHSVTKAQIGLGNCDNTADLDKPISTATQTALNGKQATISDLATIRSNAQAGKAASDTIATYGDIVTHDVAEFATATQGAKADTALQSGDLATVATSGSYTDLSDKPTIPTTLAGLTGDVSISSPSGGEHLVYDAVTSKWKNTPSAATVSWGGIGGTLSNQTDLQNALDAKADTSLSNITSAGKEVCASMTLPDTSRYTELTIGASETNYTAPADGWFSFDARIAGAGYGVGLVYANNGHFESRSNCSGTNQVCGVVIPVNKGQIITISYTTLATTNPRANLRFYYAKGAQ